MKRLFPNLTSVGIIYNPGESNSVAVVKRIRQYVRDNKNLSLRLEERPVSTTADVSNAVESLRGKTQAIYVPPDNTVHGAMKVVCRLANQNMTPVFSTTETSLADGAFAALSLDFYKLGEESGKLAVHILEGKAFAGNLPIKTTESPRIIINGTLVDQFKVDLAQIKNQPNVEIKVK